MALDGRAGAGAFGPRLAGRLTAELILRSPQYMSCIGYYEIDLRGNKIGAIENLGATENQFDSLDLSDNAVVRLDGFPKLARLKVLLLNNNRVAKIARDLQASIPNLHTLVLTNNRISELKDLDALATLPKLEMLSLLGNPVATKPHYRLYLIGRLPKLKVLDFKKVKQKEREEAAKLAEGAAASSAPAGKTFEPGEGLPEAMDAEGGGGEEAAAAAAAAEAEAEAAAAAAPKATAAPSVEQLTAIKAAIANAQTLEEVRVLEQALKEGHMPSQFQFKGGGGSDADGGEANGDAAAMEQD